MDYFKYKLIETYINMVLNSRYYNARPEMQIFFFDKICKVGLCSVSLSTKGSWPEKGSKTPD